MAPRKKTHKHHAPEARPQKPPDRFFERELAGEQAPSFDVMRTLFQSAARLYTQRPWLRLLEANVIIFRDPDPERIYFCSVLGSGGELRGVQVFIGFRSFGTFLDAQEGRLDCPAEFLAKQRSVMLQFQEPGEISAPDRALAMHMGHPLVEGTEVPVFQAVRPGYCPWHVNEEEAVLLNRGLEAVTIVSDFMEQNDDFDGWPEENVYPCVYIEGRDANHIQYRIKNLTVSLATAPPPPPLNLDWKRIDRIRAKTTRQGGPLEADYVYGSGVIGEEHARKALMRIALVLDQKTGFAFPPQMGPPEEETGDMLQRAILGAIESGGFIPSAIHIRRPEFRKVLKPLAQALGTRLVVKSSLPAIEHCRKAMEEFLLG